MLKVLRPSNESILDVYVLAMNYGFSQRTKDQAVYISVYKKHVNPGFHRGASMDDPDGVLEGSGNSATIKIKSQADPGSLVTREYLERAAPDGAVRSRTLKTKIRPAGALRRRSLSFHFIARFDPLPGEEAGQACAVHERDH